MKFLNGLEGEPPKHDCLYCISNHWQLHQQFTGRFNFYCLVCGMGTPPMLSIEDAAARHDLEYCRIRDEGVPTITYRKPGWEHRHD